MMSEQTEQLRAGRRSRFMDAIRPTGDVHGQYAGFASRGLGLVIDLALMTIVSVGTIWVINATLALFGVQLDECTQYVPQTDFQSLLRNLCRTVRGAEYLFGLLLPLAYFFVFWVLGGQTVGMGIAGVQVVSTAGTRVTALAALLRLVGYAASILSLGLGFVWSLADERRQGWHDKLAGTYVVYRRQPRLRGRQVQAGFRESMSVRNK
jgi:uncharacterized RDD family membrane protein YckC